MAISNSTVLSDTVPTGGQAASDLDTFITNYKGAVTDRLSEEHNWADVQATDGSHAEGSARAGTGTEATQPPTNVATPQVGRSVGTTGGNEVGRLYRTTTGSTSPGRLLVSCNDSGTVVWNDAVKRVQAIAAATALTIETGNIDFTSGAGVTKGGVAATEFDLHAHQLRHRDVNTATVDAFDFVPWTIPAAVGTAPGLTYTTPTDVTAIGVSTTAATVSSWGAWTVVGRRTASRAVLFGGVQFDYASGSMSKIITFIDDGAVELTRTRKTVSFNEVTGVIRVSFLLFAVVTGISANTTYRLRVLTDSAGAPAGTVDARNIHLALIDLGIV